MPIKAVKNISLPKYNEAVELTNAEAVDGVEGASVVYTNKSCGKILLLISNADMGSPKTATIVKGNGLEGTEDLKISVASQKEVAIVIESGKFVNVSGTNKGKVIVKGEDTNIKVRAVELP